jgi:hypothetical protein
MILPRTLNMVVENQQGQRYKVDRFMANLNDNGGVSYLIISWSVGPSLTSTRASHCAVGLGNGSIILTGKPISRLLSVAMPAGRKFGGISPMGPNKNISGRTTQ